MAIGKQPTYDPVAKSLHWFVFVLLAAQFVVAVLMPPIRRGVVPETFINLHMSLGMVLMALAIVRWLWRLAHPVPVARDGPPWQLAAARLTHALFYLLLIVLPPMGWAAASARDWRITVFGLFELPRLLPPRARIGFLLGDVHNVMSWTLLALVALHVAAALYHHFVARDRVLRRMLPGGGV